MIISDVMGELGLKLEAIVGLRVFDYIPDNVAVPAAVVAFPDSYTYDTSYQRGVDSLLTPVTVLVGKVSDRASRDVLSAFTDGSGASSVKQALEAKPHTAMSTVRVASVDFSTISIAAVEYLAGTFSVEVTGPGA